MNSISSFSPIYSTPQLGATNNSCAPEASNGININYSSQDEVVINPHLVNMPTIHGKRHSIEGDDVKFARNLRNLFLDVKPNSEGNYQFKPGTKQYAASASMATTQLTIDKMSEKFGGKIGWAFKGDKPGLTPDAGLNLNAYYSRNSGSLNFFHAPSRDGSVVYSGASGEVVSHEVGHAILDGMRPDFLRTWKADTNGFHEAFADLTALYMATQDDAVCELAAEQTGGDFKKPNCLSNTGEQLGRAINTMMDRNVTGGDFIRTMINDYKWQDPSTVPDNAELNTEMHSWSRIFSGATYDILSGIVATKTADGMALPQAIKSAGDDCMTLLADAIKMSPKEDASYRDIALLMLKSDANNGGKYHDIILNTMQERNILESGDDTPSDFSLEEVGTRSMTITLGDDFGIFSGAEVTGTVSNRIGLEDGMPGDELAKDMKQLIKNGCILYTEPNQKVELKDMFDKNGNPYVGVVRWTEGKMVIERNDMIG